MRRRPLDRSRAARRRYPIPAQSRASRGGGDEPKEHQRPRASVLREIDERHREPRRIRRRRRSRSISVAFFSGHFIAEDATKWLSEVPSLTARKCQFLGLARN